MAKRLKDGSFIASTGLGIVPMECGPGIFSSMDTLMPEQSGVHYTNEELMIWIANALVRIEGKIDG
jgi:hypothetical protein